MIQNTINGNIWTLSYLYFRHLLVHSKTRTSVQLGILLGLSGDSGDGMGGSEIAAFVQLLGSAPFTRIQLQFNTHLTGDPRSVEIADDDSPTFAYSLCLRSAVA